MAEVEGLIQHIPEVPFPILRSHPDSYADSLFIDATIFVELHRKVTFLKIKYYDGTSDPMDHVAS